MNLDQIANEYEETLKTFLNLEGRPWNYEGNMMELYKQIGELGRAMKEAQEEKQNDELLDVFCQIIRLAKHYEIPLKNLFENLSPSPFENLQKSLIDLIDHTGDLSKNIMTKEKYYFRSSLQDPRYQNYESEILSNMKKIIETILSICEGLQIDLNKISTNSRKIDKIYFEKMK